jgi:hypothetical protein
MNQAIFPSRRGRLPASAAAGSLLWVARTLSGLLMSFPVLSALDATGIGSGPDRDAVLFRPGSLLLLEAVRVGMPWLGSALKTALLIGALGALAELVPLACAFDLLCEEERPFGARVARAIQCFPRFLALGMIALIAQAALLLGASLLDAGLKSALQSADERVLSSAPLALLAFALLASLWLNGVLDLARAAVVERDLGARGALLRALTILRERPFDVLSGSYASALAAGFAYLTAAWLVAKVDLTEPLGSRIALCFAVHQVAVLFGIAWRVRWLGHALGLNAEHRESARD